MIAVDTALATSVPRVAAIETTIPRVSAAAAAAIDVPVLLAYGATDLSPDPDAEPATYPAAPRSSCYGWRARRTATTSPPTASCSGRDCSTGPGRRRRERRGPVSDAAAVVGLGDLGISIARRLHEVGVAVAGIDGAAERREMWEGETGTRRARLDRRSRPGRAPRAPSSACGPPSRPTR